jgi:hypothetical protein
MEEKIIRHLNWLYYGVMVAAIVAYTVMYYVVSKGLMGFIDPNSPVGQALQFAVIITALTCIPFGLYLIKWKKPKTLKEYEQLAAVRIFIVGGNMIPAILIYFLLGCYRPMIWVAAISAVAWYFTKPTLGKMEQEMKPKDPNEETY